MPHIFCDTNNSPDSVMFYFKKAAVYGIIYPIG